MTLSDHTSAEELEIRVKERTAELEKANQTLRAEILASEQEKRKVQRYNSVLGGINRILGCVVEAETEEEPGNVCLSVAMEITGSQIGFVGEVGTDGLMHDIAISNKGWNRCTMCDKMVHRFSPENIVLRDLCSSILNDGKGFFTNDPASPSDTACLPQDQLSIASFLGVPLIENGKMVGMLAVANREGGYDCEQQEDLEAIASAVVQVLQKKREEQKRKQSEKAMQDSEEHYRSLYENSLDGILLTRPDGTILSANPQACQMFGMTEDEIIRAGREGIVVKDEKLVAALEERELTGRMRAELTYRRKDGSTFAGEVTSHLFADCDCVIKTSMIVRDVTRRKRAEDMLRQSEQRIRLKLETILSPAQEISSLELAEIVDIQAIKSLMDDFYKLTHIPIGLNDLKGNVLAGVGWQDICTKFHRAHPETCKHCIESNIKLSTGVIPGEFKLYKCKNNIWDITTPIMVGEQQVGILFLGQFFFTDEPLDHGFFLSQARKYGFNEEEYITALEKVPRLSWEAVNTGMTFLAKLANMISQLSYSNIKLAHSLAERNALVEALQESEEKYRTLIETANEGIWIIDTENRIIYVNSKMAEMLGYSPKEMISRSGWDFIDERDKAIIKLDWEKRRQGMDESREFKFIRKDGSPLWTLVNTKSFFGKDGKFTGSMGMLTDITRRKEADEALKKAYDNLEEKVKERTAELEQAYISLKESEEGLAEAQSMAHIGNWKWNPVTDEKYWSDEVYRIFGLKPQAFEVAYNTFLSYVHPDDKDYVDNATEEALKGKPYSINFRILLADGEERIVHEEGEVVFDEKNVPLRMKGTIQDVTEFKKAEEKIQNLANIVESSNDAIVTQSLDGIITSWNKAAEQIYGYSTEEILGKDASILEPDNVKGEIKYFSEKIKQGKRVQHYETLRLRKDGNIINISVTLSPIFNASGKLVALSAIVRDITERKRAEEALQESEARLRRFYESGMFGVFSYNMDGSITDANDKFLEIVGYTREDLQGPVNWHKITPPEYRLLDEKCIAELKAFGVYKPYEKEYIRKDGSHVPIILGAATFDRERHEGIAFVLDNTERKKTEKVLAEMDKIRIKEIHHRIKNNLQVISSLLDLQAEKFEDEKVREAFREGQNRVISMSLIHEELYKGKGNDTLDFSAYLRELAEKLFQTYSLNSKNITLLMDLEENAFFDMDTAVPLGTIVNELISNSFKHAFTENQEGEIQIRLCREGPEEKCDKIQESIFSLTISDNGKGIPEDLELESAESLGLQLVGILVNQLDGKIEIKREQGTEFRITFIIK